MATDQPAKQRTVHADATKDFFVTMITRDITLRDCIFDLLDNAIDGARRTPAKAHGNPFDGYLIKLNFNAETFRVDDNCGGIKLGDAIDYAFHFGRRPDSPTDVKGGIGLYGIGMKRAIFKIGRYCEVHSETPEDSFKVTVDVDAWTKSTSWDFNLDDAPRTGRAGTIIDISRLKDEVKEMLGDPGFRNSLIQAIARDYTFFVQKGLKITVGEDVVPSFRYQLRQSENLAPAVVEYEEDGVKVRILAGFVDDLPDDIPDELRPDKVDRFGWFVVCNDRVVLAADKSDKTVWGNDNYNGWHPQYNGFGGFVFFEAEDQQKLPWTTTKRELDASSPLYRRAIERMKVVTTTFIEYTNRRKGDLERAKQLEATTAQVEVSTLRTPQPLRLPTLATAAPRSDLVNIIYKKDRQQIEEIKKHLGRLHMSAKDVGIETFEYFRRVELGK